ncbi:MAG: GNAT family N-acetyltransferase [Synergistaceae bacterium]|jgi:GNAT superfamily N-acetyltransferase|nr:GNAT family N-acetyltransferase [Synergistaceae bacterium]
MGLIEKPAAGGTELDGRYVFYDSRLAVTAEELQDLYRYTRWGRSRSVEGIGAMLAGAGGMIFSARLDFKLAGFCRVVTDFVYRASLWDVIVHPEHQGKGLGSALVDYALTHPAIVNIPLIMTFTSEWIPFMASRGFETDPRAMVMLRRPIEYS